MQINVLAELRRPIGTVTVIDVDEDAMNMDGLEIEGLRGTVSLLRTDEGLLVTMAAAGVAREICSRCLADANCELDVAFDEEYVPLYDPETGTRIRSSVAPDAFRIPADFVLDLREGLRQYLLMSEPAKPLCRTDCAGLCPNCGANLNDGQCSCTEIIDERWRALAGVTVDQRGGR